MRNKFGFELSNSRSIFYNKLGLHAAAREQYDTIFLCFGQLFVVGYVPRGQNLRLPFKTRGLFI